MKKYKKSKNKKLGSRGNAFPVENRIKIAATVKDLAEPLCESEGIELVYVEYQPEAAGMILRLYIDKPQGVTIDDCTYISRQLGDILDVNLEGAGAYRLEVSSPGPDRPLWKKNDFDRFKGNLARIKTSHPFDGQKNFKGILLGISDEKVKLMVDNKNVAIPLGEIARARLVNYGENRCL
ncbi:MAG: ribosome maturation factor RimP [Thermodesulfobacteriota bacterium]|nr:ribosome maturation factor RimP [Thermodesulfobacteriota bacterium]